VPTRLSAPRCTCYIRLVIYYTSFLDTLIKVEHPSTASGQLTVSRVLRLWEGPALWLLSPRLSMLLAQAMVCALCVEQIPSRRPKLQCSGSIGVFPRPWAVYSHTPRMPRDHHWKRSTNALFHFQHRNCLGSRFVPDAVIAEKLQGVPSNSGRISVKNLGQHTETEGLGHVPVSTFRRGIAQVASKAEDMVFSMRYQTFAFCDEFVKQKSGSTASITSHSKTTGRVSFNPPFILF
jgi:hypothetical protein